VGTKRAQPERNPATTGQLVRVARRQDSVQPTSTAMHYYAKTTYRANYFYWLIYALSIIASLVYFVVRIFYIASGKMGVKLPLNLTVEVPGSSTMSTVSALLGDRVQIGDEIPDSLLNSPGFEGMKRVVDRETYSYWWSCIVLAAEIGGFILVHLSQQMFVRQDTKFYPLPPEHVQKLRDVRLPTLMPPCHLPHCQLPQLACRVLWHGILGPHSNGCRSAVFSRPCCGCRS
jgi:hypothetical protein